MTVLVVDDEPNDLETESAALEKAGFLVISVQSADAALEVQYGPAHAVQIQVGSLLGDIVGAGSFQVNSLHSQGIDKLAPPLNADAVAPDGQIEAVSMPDAKAFLLGVQWHPEWHWAEDELSTAILQAFGESLT